MKANQAGGPKHAHADTREMSRPRAKSLLKLLMTPSGASILNPLGARMIDKKQKDQNIRHLAGRIRELEAPV
jgi:hypothetical protein